LSTNGIPNLPKDPRTLLNTPRTATPAIRPMGNGEYTYFGVETVLVYTVSQWDLSLHDLNLIVNVDGISLSKSNNASMWPICLMIDCKCHKSSPCLIAAYVGEGEPPLNLYLEEFLAEMRTLIIQGLNVNNQIISVSIRCFVCDAPARSFLKNTTGHSGYYACERCITKGVYSHGAVHFIETDCPLRHDLDIQQVEHFRGQTPLTTMGIGLVTQFPLDYMHLACLGVQRRLLYFWFRLQSPCRQSNAVREQMSLRLTEIGADIPCEFVRKPRSLRYLDRWKATELRTFMLYVGIVTTKLLPSDFQKNFLLFSIAMRIYLCDGVLHTKKGFAKHCMEAFVTNSIQLYGQSFASDNVHSTIHLIDDAHRYGNLHSISSFPFETFLGQIKKLLRGPNKPIHQLHNRVAEHCANKVGKMSTRHEGFFCPYGVGPSMPDGVAHFRKWVGSEFTLTTTHPNNGIVLQNHRLCKIHDIFVLEDGRMQLAVRYFLVREDFFNYPCCSSEFHIYKVRNNHLSSEEIIDLSNVKNKVMLLTVDSHSSLAIPLLSSINACE
jgi:hypothetical protein